MHHLVYLHGFLSSPQSIKAQTTLAYVKKHFPSVNVYIPQLPGDITQAVNIIDSLVNTLPIGRTGFIGSSMGGFLSTYCIEKYGAQNETTDLPKAVIINPAVEPHKLLADYVGSHVNPYTKEVFNVHQNHLNILKHLYVNKLLKPQRYKVLLQKGDETLDYKLAEKKYAASNLHIEDGGDHSFIDYGRHLPSILKFLISR